MDVILPDNSADLNVGAKIALWFIGYALGIVLFAVVPAPLIGWIIMPIGVVITIWVLLARVKAQSLFLYPILSFIWTLIAVIGDYVFIVRAFSPIDGYYKLDVYLYYGLTFLLPLAVGWWKSAHLVVAARRHRDDRVQADAGRLPKAGQV